MPDINMQVFEEVKRNQLVTEVDVQTQVALDDYQMQLSDIANPTQSQDNVVIDRNGEFLPHWNKSLDFDTWVKMSMEIAGKRILILRGNNGLSSRSSITDVMIIGTDGIDTTDFNLDSGISQSGGIISVTGALTWNTNGFRSIDALDRTSNEYTLEFKWRAPSGQTDLIVGYSQISSLSYETGFNLWAGYITSDMNVFAGSNVHDFTGTQSADTWETTTIDILQLNDYNVNYGSETYAGSSTANNLGIAVNQFRAVQIDFDHVFVRKYTATEPTWVAGGEEQNIAVALKSLGRAG